MRAMVAVLAAFTLPAFTLPALAQEHQHGGAKGASDEGAKVPVHQKHPLDAGAPKPGGTQVQLEVSGDKASAYVARPPGAAKGAILVIHEWWGLNDWVKHQADQLAQLGYLALAVDLYKG